MPLMERVATLIRANLNDLIERAEDPEVMLKQVILDMRNQMMQVKTQVATAIAGQHVLARKRQEQEQEAADWVRKAELAVAKGQDDLARGALERSLECKGLAAGLQQEWEHQSAEVERLKTALRQLTEKLEEAQRKSELLSAKYRRARVMQKAEAALVGVDAGLEERLAKLEKQDRIEQLLAEMKARHGA